LSVDEDDELEKDADLLLAVVLGLQLVGDVLPWDQLLLESNSLLGSNVGSLELVLNVGGVLQGVLELELVLQSEGQMQGI
jgi:hypothetical protein